MDREGRKTGRRKLTHGTRETERMGEKGWNGCRSSCRGTSLRGRFPHGSGNDDDNRRDMRQTHCAAKPNAVRCDGRCTALRHFTQTIPMRQEGPNNHPHSRPSVCKDYGSPTRPCHRNPASYPKEAPVEPAPRDRPTDCQKEYKEPKNRTERAKKPKEERCATGRSGPKERTKETGRQNGAGTEAERRKTCDRTERAKGLNEKRRMWVKNTNGRLCCACHWNIILCKSALESGARKLLHQRRPMS